MREAGDEHWGPAGGYCFEYCDANNGCPGSGGAGFCIAFSSGSELCMKACNPAASPSECRAGYECHDLGQGEGVCMWGHCTDDAQCTVTGDCETDVASDQFGWCVSPAESCSNGIDDDFDGRIDCADAECADLGICTGQTCTPPSGAVLACGTTLTGQSNDAAGSTDVIEGADCYQPDGDHLEMASEWGPEYAYTLTVLSPQLVTISVTNFTGDLDVYVIKEIIGLCDAYRGCFALGGAGVSASFPQSNPQMGCS